MALYDVPAFIDFVLEVTGADSIPIIGHSQGTLTTFAYSAITKTKKVRGRWTECSNDDTYMVKWSILILPMSLLVASSKRSFSQNRNRNFWDKTSSTLYRHIIIYLAALFSIVRIWFELLLTLKIHNTMCLLAVCSWEKFCSCTASTDCNRWSIVIYVLIIYMYYINFRIIFLFSFVLFQCNSNIRKQGLYKERVFNFLFANLFFSHHLHLKVIYSAICDLTLSPQVSHLIALAPIFHLGGVKGMFRMLVPFKHGFQTFFDKATNGSFLASGKVMVYCV